MAAVKMTVGITKVCSLFDLGRRLGNDFEQYFSCKHIGLVSVVSQIVQECFAVFEDMAMNRLPLEVGWFEWYT